MAKKAAVKPKAVDPHKVLFVAYDDEGMVDGTVHAHAADARDAATAVEYTGKLRVQKYSLTSSITPGGK